jgi:hypothetical protein
VYANSALHLIDIIVGNAFEHAEILIFHANGKVIVIMKKQHNQKTGNIDTSSRRNGLFLYKVINSTIGL